LECLSLCWHTPLRRDHPGYCTAEVGNPGRTYELPCIRRRRVRWNPTQDVRVPWLAHCNGTVANCLKSDVCVRSFHCKRNTKNCFSVLSLASSVLLPGWEESIVVHSFSFYSRNGVRQHPVSTEFQPLYGSIHPADSRGMIMEQWWNGNWPGVSQVLAETAVPVLVCPAQVLGLPQVWTRALNTLRTGFLNCLNARSRGLNDVIQLLYCVSLKIYNKFANYFCELKFSGNTHQRP